MMANFPRSGYPIFRASSRSKVVRKSIHFNGSHETIELLLRALIHLSIWKRWKFLPTSLRQKILLMNSSGETCGKNTSENSRNFQKTRGYPNCVLMRVWSLLNENNASIVLNQKDNRCNISAKSTRCLAMKRWPVWEDGFEARQESVQSWTWRFAIVMNKKVLKFKFHLCFKTIPFLGLESWMALVNTWQNRCWPRKKRTQLRGNPLLKTKTEAYIETHRSNDQKCFEVSKAITRLLRHDQSVPRGIDGAVRHNYIIQECRRKNFDDASQSLLED